MKVLSAENQWLKGKLEACNWTPPAGFGNQWSEEYEKKFGEPIKPNTLYAKIALLNRKFGKKSSSRKIPLLKLANQSNYICVTSTGQLAGYETEKEVLEVFKANQVLTGVLVFKKLTPKVTYQVSF